MGLAHKSFGPHNSPSKPGCPTSWLDRGVLVMPIPTAQSIRPINNAGSSSSAQEMHRSTRQFFDFALDAFLSFGYPRRAFNNLYLRDYFNSTVCFDEVEKRNRHACVCRFLWRSEPIKCPPLHPLYKKDRRRLLLFVKSPFSSF